MRQAHCACADYAVLGLGVGTGAGIGKGGPTPEAVAAGAVVVETGAAAPAPAVCGCEDGAAAMGGLTLLDAEAATAGAAEALSELALDGSSGLDAAAGGAVEPALAAGGAEAAAGAFNWGTRAAIHSSIAAAVFEPVHASIVSYGPMHEGLFTSLESQK